MKKYTLAVTIAFALLLHFAYGTSLAAQDAKSNQSLEYQQAQQQGNEPSAEMLLGMAEMKKAEVAVDGQPNQFAVQCLKLRQ